MSVFPAKVLRAEVSGVARRKRLATVLYRNCRFYVSNAEGFLSQGDEGALVFDVDTALDSATVTRVSDSDGWVCVEVLDDSAKPFALAVFDVSRSLKVGQKVGIVTRFVPKSLCQSSISTVAFRVRINSPDQGASLLGRIFGMSCYFEWIPLPEGEYAMQVRPDVVTRAYAELKAVGAELVSEV
jgi:hypothetical protein